MSRTTNGTNGHKPAVKNTITVKALTPVQTQPVESEDEAVIDALFSTQKLLGCSTVMQQLAGLDAYVQAIQLDIPYEELVTLVVKFHSGRDVREDVATRLHEVISNNLSPAGCNDFAFQQAEKVVTGL